jgi:hypothetical protein
MPLTDLPLELVSLILSYFPSREIARLATVCRQVNAAAYDIFLRTLGRYGVRDMGGRGYSNYRASIELERVQVQSTWSFMARMEELRGLLEMFEQQIDYMMPVPTRFVPRSMLDGGDGIADWVAPNARMRWVLQERVGSRCPAFRMGAEVSDPRDVAALVDCSTMVQCLLELIRDLQRADVLRGFDHDTRALNPP